MRYNLLNFPAGVVPVTRAKESDTVRVNPSDRLEKVAASVEQGPQVSPLACKSSVDLLRNTSPRSDDRHRSWRNDGSLPAHAGGLTWTAQRTREWKRAALQCWTSLRYPTRPSTTLRSIPWMRRKDFGANFPVHTSKISFYATEKSAHSSYSPPWRVKASL